MAGFVHILPKITKSVIISEGLCVKLLNCNGISQYYCFYCIF